VCPVPAAVCVGARYLVVVFSVSVFEIDVAPAIPVTVVVVAVPALPQLLGWRRSSATLRSGPAAFLLFAGGDFHDTATGIVPRK
jgi:hypothetical protein